MESEKILSCGFKLNEDKEKETGEEKVENENPPPPVEKLAAENGDEPE